MNLGQAQLGSMPSISLGGYIPAPAYHVSPYQQALAMFLGNAGGALADRAIGAGAQRVGALTPSETTAAQQAAEASRHNITAETIAQEAEDRQGRLSDADIANLRFKQGLDTQDLALRGELGRGELGQRGAALGETTRHNKAEEAVVGPTVANLEAEARGKNAQGAVQENVMHTMAVQQLLSGLKPDDPQYKALLNASRKVPLSAYKNVDEWSNAVNKQVQADAAAALGGGPTVQTGSKSSPITEAIASRGLLPAIGDAMQSQGGDGLDHTSLPGIIENGLDPQNAVLADAIKRFLVGGASRYDQPVQLNRYAPPRSVSIDDIR